MHEMDEGHGLLLFGDVMKRMFAIALTTILLVVAVCVAIGVAKGPSVASIALKCRVVSYDGSNYIYSCTK